MIEMIKCKYKTSASFGVTKVAKCAVNIAGKIRKKKGSSRPFASSSFLFVCPARRENSRAISIRRGSMEHINKKSFPACTRVTAHATSLQPLQPIFPALTSREVGQSGGCTRGTAGGGGIDGGEHERVSRREMARCEKGKGRKRDELEGWRLSCGSISGGGKPTANERNISLKKRRPLPLYAFHPQCTIGLVGPRTSTSRIDSLAILLRDDADFAFFRERRQILAVATSEATGKCLYKLIVD